jgi:hypothetical protein
MQKRVMNTAVSAVVKLMALMLGRTAIQGLYGNAQKKPGTAAGCKHVEGETCDRGSLHGKNTQARLRPRITNVNNHGESLPGMLLPDTNWGD